jgi:hypothetical protein
MGAALQIVHGEGKGLDGFEGVRARLEETVAKLHVDEVGKMNHREIEDLLLSEGNELLRQLFQSHLDLRSSGREKSGQVTGADGAVRDEARDRERDLETRFGTVKVNRVGYGKAGKNSLFPLDGELNLPRGRYSHSIRRIVAEEAAKGSFDEVVDSVNKHTGAHVPKRQAEQLAVMAAVDFEAFYERRHDGARQGRGRTGSILAISTDGAGFRVYPEDLRQPKEPKERTGSKLVERLSPGEKPGLKRMATVAAVYTVKPYVRTPADIFRTGMLEDKGERPKPEHKRVWANAVDKAEDVIEDAFLEALMRDPKRRKRWVALVDGNEPQLAAMLRLGDEYDVDLTVVLDCVHVTEYVWSAAHVFHPDDNGARKEWVAERLIGIMEGNCSNVAAGIRRSATLRGLSSKDRRAADECADYLLKYAPYMKYHEYLRDGLPVATGVVEGAGRYLVQDRMDISGARWHLGCAEAVLRLRAIRASGDFKAYWSFHEQCEKERVHTGKYKNGKIPRLDNPSSGRHLKVVK